MRRYITLLIFGCLIVGCTETIPFELEFTGRTDWAPTILLAENGYNRFVLNVSRPPWRELLRNIAQYTVEVRELPSGSFAPVDTLGDKRFTAANNYNTTMGWYNSDPVLNFNQDYQVRVSVHYRDGTVRPSPEVTFQTPVQRSKVLTQVPFPEKQPSLYARITNTILSVGDKLYVIEDEQLFEVDTSTGQAEFVDQEFAALPPGDPNETFRQFTVWNDRILMFYYDDVPNEYDVFGYNTTNREFDYKLEIPREGRSLLSFAATDSLLYLLWDAPSQKQQISVMSFETKDTVKIFPEFPERIGYPYHFYVDSTESLWFSQNGSFDNRIIRMDPSTFSITEQHHNPIFYTAGLAWDKNNFWVIDYETSSVVKLQLEGM